jgi:hypothetical protein
MSTLAPESVIARSPSAVTSEVEGEVMMMNVEQGRYFSLNDVASEVWHCLAQPISFADLVARIADSYDAAPDAIAADLQKLLADMREREVIEVS